MHDAQEYKGGDMDLDDLLDDLQRSIAEGLHDIAGAAEELCDCLADGFETARTRQDRCFNEGDVIAVRRMAGAYQHYGIYIGGGEVIHYAAPGGDFGDSICVHKTAFDRFLDGGEGFALEFSQNYTGNVIAPLPASSPFGAIKTVADLIKSIGYRVYSGKETVQRAYSRLGENKYSLIFNNCEHFALWCKTGISESRQVEAVLSALLRSGSRSAA